MTSASKWLVLIFTIVIAPPALAQLAPSGEHYAGRATDTGYGGALVNATGAFAASIPFDLPPARAALPIPLRIAYGASGVGAAGLGWDLPLSYIAQDRTFAHRRPASNPGDLPGLRQRTYIALSGEGTELVQDGSAWVARYGTLELSVHESGGSWIAYDGMGRTYTFVRPTVLGATGFWLLKSVSKAGGNSVQLTYRIDTWPLDGGAGYAIDLIRIDYNTSAAAGCAKNEIGLTYGHGSISPVSISVVGGGILVRKNTLTWVDVESRATCATPFERLRRYDFQYAPDTDTGLPRLVAVRMFGRQGTPEENVALPVAGYGYGSATSNGVLRYERTQTINLPVGVSYDQISGTALDSSVNAPVGGDRYAMWQSLTDISGDGRPDLVFKKNGRLWAAYNRPAPNGGTTLGAGLQAIVQLSDATFSSGAFSTQTSAQRRFDYAPASRNTTDVWRKAIDVNGDGRMDIIDAAEEPDRWVVYLNTPGGPTGVKWERRSFLVTNLRAALTSSGHKIEGPHVPLSRRATGMDLQIWQCWRWDGTQWQWYAQGFANHRCQGVAQTVIAHGPERTFVEWDVVDLNGDGYPDFVFDSTPVDFQLNPPPSHPTQPAGATVDGKAWHQFAPAYANQVRASFNVVGVRFDTNHDPFSRSVDLFAASANQGVGEWQCPGYSLGGSCDESYQSEFAGFADINGDGLVDRVIGTRAYLGTYSGTAVTFASVYLTLPGPLATQYNNHDEQCVVGGTLKPTSVQTQGLRDLTGDGIPDYYDKGRVWIGTGTGFRSAIPIAVTGATFQFSHETESCNGDSSNTDGGLFDIDADGRPEIIGLSGNTILVSALAGGHAPGVPESGRLTEIDNGYGAKTSISYLSAKNFTANAVPFPEIVVSSVATTGTLNLGGTLAQTRYAYGGAELVFDSALDRFSFPGYGRVIQLRLLGSSESALPSGAKLAGIATITDRWPLTPFSLGMTAQQRWVRAQRVGRVRDILMLRGIGDPNPWALLDVDGSSPAVIGAVNFEWNAKMYEVPVNAAEDLFDCMDMVAPLDYVSSFLDNVGTGNFLDTCRTHGFAFITSQYSWYGGSPPPSDDNIQTRTQTLAVDDFGRSLVTEYDNDVFRGDDDICERDTFAVPNGSFPRALDALASRQFYTCGKNPNANITVAGEAWSYDNLPPGSVSNGLITSHNVDRRATDTGALLNSIRLFDATYDAAGNLAALRTQRGGATRTLTFSYDSFALLPTDVRLDATGTPPTELVMSYDPISLEPRRSGVIGQTQHGIDFDGFGRPIRSTVTPPGGSPGVLSTTSYAGFDNADPDGRRVALTRFSNPVAPANVSSSPGRSGTMFLDELGRERRLELSLGADYANAVLVVNSRSYDDAGRIAFEPDPYVKGQHPATVYGTTYYFDDSGELRCLIRGRGHQAFNMASDIATERFPTCFERSFAGHLEVFDVSDAVSLQSGSPQFGVVKSVVATAIGRVLERSTVGSGVRLDDAVFGYDALGQTTSMTRFRDPVGRTGPVQWSLKLDSLGQTLQLAQPNSAPRSYSYSDWGEPLETQWFDGGVDRRLVRKFDSLERLSESEESNNGVADPETVQTYAYDAAVNVSPLVMPAFVLGRLARATSASGQVTFSYDAFGRVNAQVFADDQNTLYIEKSEHDADGRLISLGFNLPDRNYDNEVVKYAYDSAGRLREVYYLDPAGAQKLYRADAIDAFGRVRKALVGGNTVFAAAYATDGRKLMKEAIIKSPLGSRRILFGQFDPVGRELSRTEFKDGAALGVQTWFAYDALGRLWRALETLGSAAIFDWHYSYDPLGNLLALDDGGASATLSYDTHDRDRVCRIGYGGGGLGGSACNVTYNSAGDIIEEPTRTGSRSLNYFDSGRIRRISEGSAQAAFRYDPFGGLVELDLSGVSNASHIWRYGDLIERRTQGLNGSASSLIYRNIPGPGGTVFASRRGTNSDWVFGFGELRGNRVFANQAGALVQDVDYQPFGEANSTGAPAGAADYTGAQWNGGQALAGFDLFQLGTRIYDPVIGRFLSRDPLLALRTGATSNPYAFAMNDPVNAADPSGNDCAGGIGQECLYLASLNPLGFLGQLWNLLADNGGSGPAPQQAPPVYVGPQTPRGIELQERALQEVGYVPKGFNLDTLAATGMSMSDMMERIREAPSAERDAAIDAYNAKLDRYANYSRVVGWSMVAIGTGGAALSEATGVVLASRGMLGAAEFFGYSVPGAVGAGTSAVVSGNQLQTELDNADDALATEAEAATGGGTGAPPPGVGGNDGGANGGPRQSRADFAASETGNVFPIPRDSTMGPSDNRLGTVFRGGPGGPALNDRVTGFRLMDPKPGLPEGYANYGREAPGQPWQSVDPFTGRTVSKDNAWWHIPLER